LLQDFILRNDGKGDCRKGVDKIIVKAIRDDTMISKRRNIEC